MDKYELVSYMSNGKVEAMAMERISVKRIEAKAGGKLARDKVSTVAADLFDRKGIRAVGVEEIVKEAGVAKISLYRNFALQG